MKRKRTVLAAVLMLAALAAIVWLYVCRNQKSSDNLPSLANLVQMEEGAIDETVCGYRRAQLCSVWGEPEESGAKQDVWTVGELALTVRYQDGGEKAVSCGLSARVFLQQTDVVQVTHFLHTDITERSLSEEEIAAVRDWVESLQLIRQSFAEGQSPGEQYEGGSSWDFAVNGGEQTFSYQVVDNAYLLLDGEWYLVLNPSDPPVEMD